MINQPIELGRVRRFEAQTTEQGTEVKISFQDGRFLTLQAQLGMPLMLAMWPASRAQDLYDAARLACHACGLPWTDPRTGITHEPEKP